MDTCAVYTDSVTDNTDIILPGWQKVKRLIYPVVLETPRPGRPAQSPIFDKFLDLYICYSIRLPVQGNSEPVLLPVDNRMLVKWGTSRAGMAAQAMENLKNDGYKATSVYGILKEAGDGIPPVPHLPLYALTNRTRAYGAAGILDRSMISGLAKKLGADLFLVPSSIHEFLILPDDGQTSIEWINRIIADVNDAQVGPRERLSDHVYRYNRELDTIEIPM